MENKVDRLDLVVVDEIENNEDDIGIEVIRFKGYGKYGKKRKLKKNVRRVSINSSILREFLNEDEEDFIEVRFMIELEEILQFKVKVEEEDKELVYVFKFKEEDKLKDILSFIGDYDFFYKINDFEESIDDNVENNM